MDALDKIAELLYGSGEVLPGIEMGWEQARERVEGTGRSLWMPYCIVRDWIWIDLILTEEEQGILRSSGREAVMLYARGVLYDSERRFDVGDWVRTTPLVSFTEGCFFQTRNTLYVLVGNGQRKQAEFSTVMSLR